jgi:CheY-like chemotaxis protein
MKVSNSQSHALGLPQSDSQEERTTIEPDGVLRGLRILLVENEPYSAELLTFVLENIAGAQVITAASAEEALFKLLAPDQPDILLSNLLLPDLDGYSLVELVKAAIPKPGRSILAVALTSGDRNVNLARLRASGYYTHIPLSINPEKLVTKLARVLSSQTNWQQ